MRKVRSKRKRKRKHREKDSDRQGNRQRLKGLLAAMKKRARESKAGRLLKRHKKTIRKWWPVLSILISLILGGLFREPLTSLAWQTWWLVRCNPLSFYVTDVLLYQPGTGNDPIMKLAFRAWNTSGDEFDVQIDAMVDPCHEHTLITRDIAGAKVHVPANSEDDPDSLAITISHSNLRKWLTVPQLEDAPKYCFTYTAYGPKRKYHGSFSLLADSIFKCTYLQVHSGSIVPSTCYKDSALFEVRLIIDTLQGGAEDTPNCSSVVSAPLLVDKLTRDHIINRGVRSTSQLDSLLDVDLSAFRGRYGGLYFATMEEEPGTPVIINWESPFMTDLCDDEMVNLCGHRLNFKGKSATSFISYYMKFGTRKAPITYPQTRLLYPVEIQCDDSLAVRELVRTLQGEQYRIFVHQRSVFSVMDSCIESEYRHMDKVGFARYMTDNVSEINRGLANNCPILLQLEDEDTESFASLIENVSTNMVLSPEPPSDLHFYCGERSGASGPIARTRIILYGFSPETRRTHIDSFYVENGDLKIATTPKPH